MVSSRLIQGTFWSLLGAVLSRSLTLLSYVIIGRILGSDGFGEMGIIQSTVAMFQVFAVLGLGLTMTKYVAEFRTKDPEKVGRIIGLAQLLTLGSGALISILFYTLAPWLAKITLVAPHLEWLLKVGALMLMLGALTSTQNGILAGFEAFRAIAWINLITGILSIPILIAGTYWKGLEGAIWGLVATLGVNWLMNFMKLRVEIKRAGTQVRIKGCEKEWSMLWKFSLPAALSSIVITPAYWMGNAILVNQQTGYAALGIFTAADKWRQLLIFVPTSLSSFFLSSLSNLYGVENEKYFKKYQRISFLVNTLTVFPASLVLIILSTLAMSAYGSDYQLGWLTLIILSVSANFVVLNNYFAQILVSTGLIWWRFLFDIILAGLYISFCWLLIPVYLERGMALASLFSFVGVVLLLIGLVPKALNRNEEKRFPKQQKYRGKF
jgi:O-antigen/teichoic acid export membrane protein